MKVIFDKKASKNVFFGALFPDFSIFMLTFAQLLMQYF